MFWGTKQRELGQTTKETKSREKEEKEGKGEREEKERKRRETKKRRERRGMEEDTVLFEDYVYFPRDREISTGRWSKFYLVLTPKVGHRSTRIFFFFFYFIFFDPSFSLVHLFDYSFLFSKKNQRLSVHPAPQLKNQFLVDIDVSDIEYLHELGSSEEERGTRLSVISKERKSKFKFEVIFLFSLSFSLFFFFF